MHVETYKPHYQTDFRALNEEWISSFFVMEEADYLVLDHPEEYILNKGGEIFVAVEGTKVLGVCAMLKTQQAGFDYELAKMAVSPYARGKGIGFSLGTAAIDWAKEKGAQTIFLDSNTSLESAIRLYHRLGFKEVKGISSPYQRTNIQMIMKL